jgi:hypothetical protein
LHNSMMPTQRGQPSVRRLFTVISCSEALHKYSIYTEVVTRTSLFEYDKKLCVVAK